MCGDRRCKRFCLLPDDRPILVLHSIPARWILEAGVEPSSVLRMTMPFPACIRASMLPQLLHSSFFAPKYFRYTRVCCNTVLYIRVDYRIQRIMLLVLRAEMRAICLYC